jgi:basic membrane protein A
MIGWALTACLSSSDCFREDVFCAALVTDTQGIDDHGIHQDAWAGLQAAEESGLADRVEFIESIDARDYLKDIAYFADQGFDVIFTSGIALADETLQSADLYPDSVFVGLSQPFEESRPNLISVTFPEDQMGFAAGVLAARLSRTGMVAAVCETSGIDSMYLYCEGFREGVKLAGQFTSTSVTVSVVYRDHGNREKLFIDEAWGYETAASLISQGVDVIFAAGGGTGQGALRAASERGVAALGVERDQAAALGGSGSGVVTSLYGAANFEVQEVMRLLQAGEFPQTRVGQVQFKPFPSNFPPDFGVGVETVLNLLANGQISTNVILKSR